MDIFSILLVILFIATAIFFIIFFSFIYYWHLKKVTFIVVPAIFTFEFFAIGFLIVAIIALVVNYLPYFINSIF
ncbi:MAG: hypothetical protein A2402_00670 [Candidatus Staskawiczbacteria bacterium RIFOXYC1_FULL_37_43]|nr:MAG: hypothetical protein A2813_01560 [Candidatus Staskawiczbacteria bacterium RIFCSPHIGHO2_01_FULL_37_17]OGZ71473.1 MAG: hypothetical protein A2891_00995 [Candidatus Staskawiczbacteria bacterium RIFCSPLOWO2_01_FULL_37_19]OGZ76134.1 MAG: hypothetical protein A2205_03740 [Candidatus Staskawiczbacteria bacterium RIFOXYA1_FULL_37_15]OGZ77459.1 MAG: hypothetical protein A2280_02905 [Candidatus Staskawiczbacteria bacterium RIFOXYA12_FULL_37_10]OGZ80102.1 MAG: hypothetical protein A2353_02460 [Can